MTQASLPWGRSDAGAQPRLQTANPADWLVQPGWASLVHDFWTSPAGHGLQRFLTERLSQGALIYPPQPLRALGLTPPEQVRVVIFGQDPYHGPGQAEGLAFSVAPGVKPPPSLRNIFKELQRDLGQPAPVDGSLVRWAQQGVLLLNSALTVEDGQPASHAARGWESLCDAVVDHCNRTGGPKVFLLWGSQAQKKIHAIDSHRHRSLCANHPSPLSARRGPAPFIGCGHFGQTNRWLQTHELAPIRW